MERFIITLDESGTLHVPDVSSTFIWRHRTPQRGRTVHQPARWEQTESIWHHLGYCHCFPAQYSWGMAFTGTRDRQDWQTWL